MPPEASYGSLSVVHINNLKTGAYYFALRLDYIYLNGTDNARDSCAEGLEF